MKLKIGDRAPDITANNQDGREIKLADFKGKKVVLYFYPKDNTPGCTEEACNLRDNYEALIKEGYVVLGVSPDSEKSHKKFISKYKLPFDLLADTEKKILNDYGVWGEKKLYGRTYMGVIRTTFVIDEKSLIEEIIEKVNVKDHSTQILK
ncbi:MAG: thioredoxin-dependent thiol peroxidase [Bacteroidetes bacterium]|nr:thioredoxin-dependent thiol peroxidase [Bacteroidota bacterium]